MVSLLWKACSEGRLDDVLELLNAPAAVDMEIKDHTGATPLIEAIKNNHIEVVRVLLSKGADPLNGSSQGPPQQYTLDPAILELLSSAQAKVSSGAPPYNSTYLPDVNGSADKAYYGPSGAYAYYPSINGHPAIPEGAVYYPPPPGAPGVPSGGIGNLPPPDIAKMIPCRYFPACRYGASCMFMHPGGPYFQGPLPPAAQYPAQYDQSYGPNYYPVSPPTFQAPPMHSLSSPASPPSHVRSTSDPAPHFSPTSSAQPVPYPLPYPVPVQMPVPPIPAAQTGPYPTSPPQSVAAFPTNPEPINEYAPLPTSPSQVNGIAPTSPLLGVERQPVNQSNHPRENGASHPRRGTGTLRRGSFPHRSSKPPCMFYPSGRCKNGNDCRFAHVAAENGAPPSFPPARGGSRGRGGGVNGHAFGDIDEKLAGLTMRDDQARVPNGTAYRPHLTTDGRPRYPQGIKNNAPANQKKFSAIKQRVPDADEFPVLTGSTTPPSARSATIPLNGINGHSGPTAAQVLQAPAPIRRESAKDQPSRDSKQPMEQKNEVTGCDSILETSHPASFASVANGSSPDPVTEVSVAA